MRKQLVLLFLALLLSQFATEAQNTATPTPPQTIDPANKAALYETEMALMPIMERMRKDSTTEMRLIANTEFIPKLVAGLKTPQSFLYKFDSLKNMSIVEAPDHSFRIFTWMVVLDNVNFNYLYFGAIQKNNTEKLELLPLIDGSAEMSSPEVQITDNEKWYGCIYYGIHQYTYNNTNYYILFGWDGNNTRSDKKIGDVLYFNNGKPSFGAPIFNIPNFSNELVMRNRLILEFKEGAIVNLSFNKDKDMILYDFLTTEAGDPPSSGNGFALVPDGTYHGVKLDPKDGVWKYQSIIFTEVLSEAPVYREKSKPAKKEKKAQKRKNRKSKKAK